MKKKNFNKNKRYLQKEPVLSAYNTSPFLILLLCKTSFYRGWKTYKWDVIERKVRQNTNDIVVRGVLWNFCDVFIFTWNQKNFFEHFPKFSEKSWTFLERKNYHHIWKFSDGSSKVFDEVHFKFQFVPTYQQIGTSPSAWTSAADDERPKQFGRLEMQTCIIYNKLCYGLYFGFSDFIW